MGDNLPLLFFSKTMKIMNTRAQGAMEYLMTYSWAILVVMTVGIVMWQLGIFNIGGTMPPRVTGTNFQKPLDATLHFYATISGANCDNDGADCLVLDLVNGEPGTITIGVGAVPISATVNTVDIGACTPDIGDKVKQGAKYIVSCVGDSDSDLLMSAGEIATAEVTIPYTVTIAGTIRTRIETASARGPIE